jgi:hypothetical protein
MIRRNNGLTGVIFLGVSIIFILTALVPSAFSFESTEQMFLTVDKANVNTEELVTIKAYAKAIIDEDVVYYANSENTGIFGSLFIVGPAGNVIERLDVSPSLNTLLASARLYSRGQSPRTAYYMKFLKGDEICLNTYKQTFSSAGIYTIFWKEGRWIYYDFDKSSAVKVFTVEVRNPQFRPSTRPPVDINQQLTQ